MLDNEKVEPFEELEEGVAEEDLIEKRKKPKNNNLKLMNPKILTLIILNIFILPIIFFIYAFYSKTTKKIQYELSTKSTETNKLKQLNLKLRHTIINPKGESETKKFSTESIAQFPCGNIISADWISIYIYDINYNLIQKLNLYEIIDQRQYWKTQKRIYKISIKDDNNFLIYSNDGMMKLYSKEKEGFELKQEFKDIEVVDAIFDKEGKIIACVRNNLIKVLKQDEKGIYKSIKSLTQADAFHLTLFENKNILFSTEIASMQFYDISQNYKLLETVKERSIHDPEKFGDDKVIVYHNNSLKIISINEHNVIRTIKIGFEAYSIKYYEEKGIILVGGIDKNNDKSVLYILNSDNFEIIKTISDIHGTCVKGIYILKNGLITTFGEDPKEDYPIKIWSLE